MKNLSSLIAVVAAAFVMPFTALAAERNVGNKPVAPSQPARAPEKIAGELKPPSHASAEAEAKVMPMYVRVDAIDPAGKTFTMKRKDGVELKHVVPEGTEVKQGPAPAKFEDIKVGDYVAGSRRKVSETEYTVLKITKFGPKKPAEKKP